jgi:hypothetical protein
MIHEAAQRNGGGRGDDHAARGTAPIDRGARGPPHERTMEDIEHLMEV